MSGYHAVAEMWTGGTFDLWVYPDEPGQHSIFGDLVTAASEDQVPEAAAERLEVAGWRVGEWERDGNTWRAPVELDRSSQG